MAAYYVPCPALAECDRLIRDHFEKGDYETCFRGHLVLAEQGYPLAECQVGYFYYEGIGVEQDLVQAFYWTKRAAEHGDRDGQCNLADLFYFPGVIVEKDEEKARELFIQAARQANDYAIERCRELGIEY